MYDSRSSLLPNLPSLPLPSLPSNLQRRLLSFLLRRSLGRFVTGGLDADAIDADLARGNVSVQRLQLASQVSRPDLSRRTMWRPIELQRLGVNCSRVEKLADWRTFCLPGYHSTSRWIAHHFRTRQHWISLGSGLLAAFVVFNVLSRCGGHQSRPASRVGACAYQFRLDSIRVCPLNRSIYETACRHLAIYAGQPDLHRCRF